MSHTMWDRDGLHVWATRDPSGGVTIEGQHLRSGPDGAGEYEYAISIPAADATLLVRALHGSPDDDVLDLLVAHGEMIVNRGEHTWAQEVGARATLWSHG